MSGYLTVVIRWDSSLPHETDLPSVGDQLFGGKVVSIAAEDSVAVLDLIEGHVDFEPGVAREARERAIELEEK